LPAKIGIRIEKGVIAVPIIEIASLGNPFFINIGVAEASTGEKPALDKNSNDRRESR
jgi:hypothetical protein